MVIYDRFDSVAETGMVALQESLHGVGLGGIDDPGVDVVGADIESVFGDCEELLVIDATDS